MAAPKCTICQQALKSEEPKLKCRGSCGKHCHFRCVTKISVAYVLFCVHNTCVYICESCTKRENATGTAAFGDSSASALPKVTGKPSHYDNAEPSAASLLRQSDVVAKEASMLKSAYDPKLVEPHDKNAVQEHRTEDTVWNRGPTKNSEGESPSPEEKPHCMLCKKAVKLSNWDKHKQHCESTLVLCDVCHGYFPRRCIEEHTTTCRKQDAYSSVSTPSPQRPPSEEVTAITVQHISSNKVQRGSSEDKMMESGQNTMRSSCCCLCCTSANISYMCSAFCLQNENGSLYSYLLLPSMRSVQKASEIFQLGTGEMSR